ncbi:MAG: polyisoprenoid-binding protein [Aeromicrobium sp.]|nr:polyisoprenoid-binding protein [Burkholderiales bacterium]
MKLSSITLAAAVVAALGSPLAIQSVQAQSATYTVEPTHTFVMWEAKHFGTSTSRGRFDKKSGSITIDRKAKTGKAEITIDMKSMNTGVAAFDKHLTGDDFFAAEKFPEAKFVGTGFKFDGDKVIEVAGTLTMHGKTNPVTLKSTGFNCYMSPFVKREVCGGDFETTIMRSQYDMSYGLPGIPDAIRLLIQVEGIKAE